MNILTITLTILMAPIQDTIPSNVHVVTAGEFGVFMLIILGIYIIIGFGNLIFNSILKNTDGHCSSISPFTPIANIACFICRIIQFFKPAVIIDFKDNHKEKRNKKAKEKAELIMQRIKERTKGLTDI